MFVVLFRDQGGALVAQSFTLCMLGGGGSSSLPLGVAMDLNNVSIIKHTYIIGMGNVWPGNTGDAFFLSRPFANERKTPGVLFSWPLYIRRLLTRRTCYNAFEGIPQLSGRDREIRRNPPLPSE